MIDEEGNVVTNTYTLNGGYGSGATARGTGVLLNNEMDDFTSKPGVPNAYLRLCTRHPFRRRRAFQSHDSGKPSGQSWTLMLGVRREEVKRSVWSQTEAARA